MGKLKSDKERRLQRKLIPLNILVCAVALVAALTLFLTPFISVDVGGILRDEGVVEFVDEQIDNAIGDTIDGTEQEDIDYKPVVAMLVKQILGKAEGEITVSGISAFRVLTGDGDKSEIVMDDLLFGEHALATSLINSVVDGVADIFETDEGKALLEDAVISTMTKGIIKSVDNNTVSDALSQKNVKELVSIFRELGDDSKVPDGKVDDVAGRFINKLDEMLGEDINLDAEDRESMVAKVQEMYDDTSVHLKPGEKVSIESIMCVTLSKNVKLSEINIEDLFDGLFDDEESEGSVHIALTDEELGGAVDGDNTQESGPEEGDNNFDAGSPEGEEQVGGGTTEGNPEEGGATEGSSNKIVTNYDDLLLEIGYDKAKKAELKEKMRTKLNDGLNKMIKDNGIDDYMGYYGYVALVMLVFMLPWIILFLFSFFHIIAKNKRFTMWYVKLFGWIPSVIWLALKLFPWLATKISFLGDFWNGEHGAIVKAAVNSIGTMTWISGLCYILIWVLSIFWAFPIKHKIRKERKNPEDGGYEA